MARGRRRNISTRISHKMSRTVKISFSKHRNNIITRTERDNSERNPENSSLRSRICSGCNGKFARADFSKKQWKKPRGVSRCLICVKENVSRDGNGFGTGRSNESSRRAVFDWTVIYASGSFRDCVLGEYRGGPRTGQKAVAKTFKDKYRYMSMSFFDTDEAAVEKALHIISSFNGNKFIPDIIRLNIPERWKRDDGEFMFVEPFIENFDKFNSNTGWISKQQGYWYEVLQSLSHFSYHLSSGQFLLCDLQGGIFRNGVILTDPVVCSRSSRFGPADLGFEGISTFFARHKCNRYCRDEWTKPRDARVYYSESEGTSMGYEKSIRRDDFIPFLSYISEDNN